MKFAIVQKTLAALAVSLILMLAGFTTGLAHDTASSGLLLTSPLHQVFSAGHAQLDRHSVSLGFDSVICVLPSPNESAVRATWTSVPYPAIPLQTHRVTSMQTRTATWRLFDAVLLI